MRTIWICDEETGKAVDAYLVLGGLAVHRTPRRERFGEYTVTHLNSGRAVRQHIKSLALARKILRALAESEIPWDEIRTSQEAKPHYKAVMDIVRSVECKGGVL